MIELIKYNDIGKWNEIINSYKITDVYYTTQYSISFMNQDKGIPYLLHYENKNVRLSYPIIEKDLSDFQPLNKNIPIGMFFDWNTPYGYGGPLCDNEFLTLEQQNDFQKDLFSLAKSRNVVSQFIRFHPLLNNQNLCNEIIQIKCLKDTVYIDLTTDDDLMIQMESKNRNLIRKAMKNNITIIHDKGKYIDDFIRIYNITMTRDHAEQFYFFPKEYYNYLIKDMKNQIEVFYALKDGQIIAASLFLYNKNYMHYHLSGNLLEYRTFAPTNLLLYEAAKWGQSKGIKYLHLGGGVGSEDSLFHFKKQFNKNGRIPFYIGRTIFNQSVYNKLVSMRKKIDSSFDINNSYFIQYRKE